MNKGVLYGIGAYVLWGVFPIYFKLIAEVPATQILGHRIVWSFGLMVAIVLVRKDWKALGPALRTPKTVAVYTLAALLLSINWLVYIWGVNSGFIVETSLGYFINPLVNVLLGVIFLRERLRPIQWLPIGLAAVGVGYMTLAYGQLPWIALTLALSFGFYGLVKKVSSLDSLHGLTLETGLMVVPATLFLLWTESQGTGAMGSASPYLMGMLMLLGVITSVPLLMFGTAVRSIPLSLLGLLQYIAPTCQFLIGVLMYGEPFDQVRLIGFSLIWLALALLWTEGMIDRRHRLGLRPSSG